MRNSYPIKRCYFISKSKWKREDKRAAGFRQHQETRMHLKQILDLIKKSVKAWVDDYAPSMGA
jgi:hypothetical protein